MPLTAPPDGPHEPITELTVRLPSWVSAACADVEGGRLATDTDAMALVNALAARNHVEGSGGPFAAVVLESTTRRLVAAGVNLVLAHGLSSLHAEVVALSLAQARTGTWDLGAGPGAEDGPGGPLEHELVVNWRPCLMCCGATLWSGVRRLVVAGDGPELERLTGFDEGFVPADWAEQFQARGISVVQDVSREDAVAVFAGYGRREDVTVYNGRGGRRA